MKKNYRVLFSPVNSLLILIDIFVSQNNNNKLEILNI